MKFSVLLLTHNEEFHLEDCLNSIQGAERVVCVDSGSTDRSLEILKKHGVEVLHHPFQSFSEQRNLGLKHFFAAGDWVLHLDADERMDRKLAREIRGLRPSKKVAFNIASLTHFHGRPIPRSSSFPVYQTRLTKVGEFEFVEVGHGQKAPPELGVLPRLRHPYHHFPFEKGLTDWLLKHDRYADREADEWLKNKGDYRLADALRDPIARRQWLKQFSRKAFFYPMLVYTYLLLIRGGILEGAAGREYCRRRFLYEMLVQMKVSEKRYRRRLKRD